MTQNEFLKKYKLPLLQCLLKDTDSGLTLYANNNKIAFKKRYKINAEPIRRESKRVTSIELEKFVSDSYNRNSFLSQEYTYTEDDLRYLEDKNLLSNLSRAKGVLWSDELIEKYQAVWNWRELSRNFSIKWTKDRISKFETNLDFKELSYNKNLELDGELLGRYSDKWDWYGISGHPMINDYYIQNFIFNNSNTKWTVTPDNHKGSWNYMGGKWGHRPLIQLRDIYYQKGYYPIKPCISTNPSINWNQRTFEHYKDKLDFWLLSLFGKIELDIILQYGDELDENRIFEINHTKSSDYYDKHPIYRNGWENWLRNAHTIVDLNLLKILHSKWITLIKHKGDASTGHTPYEVKIRISDLVQAEKLNMSFSELHTNVHFFPSNLISETSIDKTIYYKIIKPAFKKDVFLIDELATVF